ncbi:MAG: peroxiredoxin [Flavobacteriaceae bacterium]
MSDVLHDPTVFPEDLPVPEDDGGCDHLEGMRFPDVALPATDGGSVGIARLQGVTVLYAYPRTGQPGQALPTGWDGIPGARGCTPQSCSFRDHEAELKQLGAQRIFGLSTQDSDYQREARDRLHLPFEILSDAGLELSRALELPLFEVDGMTLMKRLSMVVRDGVITKVFYPVFPPDRSAADVAGWLRAQAAR